MVSRELISRESSLWGCCEMVSIRLPLTSSSRSAKESPEYTFVICSLILQAHLSPFSLLLSTFLSSQIPGWRTEQGWWYSCFLVFMKLSSWVRIKAYWISNCWQDVQLEWSQVSILSMIFTIKRFTITVLVLCLCSFAFQCTILILWSTFARLSTDCIFFSLFIITF